jgi:ATP synthase protein I
MSLIGPEGRKQLQLAASFLAVGLELAVAISIGALGGRYLDGKLGTAPYLLLLGLFLGIAAGFRSLFALARKAQKRASAPDQESGPKSPPDEPHA